MSGLQGLNLDSRDSQPDELKKWYNDKAGETNDWKKPLCLLEVLDNFKSHPKPFNKPTRVCIYDIYAQNKDGFSITTGDCFSTKVESGVIVEK
jgi:translation elongation factor EF-1alpha